MSMSMKTRFGRLFWPVLPMLFVGATGETIAAGPPKGTTVTVDFAQPLQAIDGFGASITWVANDLGNFAPADQTTILDALYNPNAPSAALSWVRAGTMLCEFNPSPGTYNFSHYLIQSEMSWLNRVAAAYGVTHVLASTWTPPAWMKSNGSCSNGGSVLPQYYPDLASTKVLWLQDAQAALGRPIDVESVQNEPDISASYDSANYTTDQITAFVTGYLKPAMTGAALTTKIMVPEPAVYGGTSYFDSNWANPILGDPNMAAVVDIMGTHGYGQLRNLSQPCTTCVQHGKPYWQTEVMNDNGGYSGSITNAQSWTTSIYQALNKGGFSAYYYWWAMNFTADNQGLVNYSNTNWTFQIPKRLYAIGQFSRFIRPGSTLLTSSSSSASLESTAALPASGTVALVLSNTSTAAITATVTLKNTTALPATVTPYVTSATQNQTQLAPVTVTNGTFTITIPATSVLTVAG
jgi:glucuronoarabinoxylan endo-1,4-beta-xylanase